MIPLFKVFMDPSAADAVAETLYSGQIAEGPRVVEFEEALGIFLGEDNVLAVNSGTSAIQLACRLAGVRNRHVITTPMTCSATTTAIRNEGGIVVWADVGPDGIIDPDYVDQLCRALPCPPAAIVTVHWAGHSGRHGDLCDVASRHGVKLIEDAAHAFGCHAHDGRKIGSHGDYVCFSFQAIKHLTTGDGGALVCRSPEDYARGKRLRWFGLERGVDRDSTQDITEVGGKFHMNDIAATIGLCNMATLQDRLDRVSHNVSALCQAMGVSGDLYGGNPLWILPSNQSVPRHVLQPRLTAAGISSSQVHVRNDILTAFVTHRPDDLWRQFALECRPKLNVFAGKQLNIPCGWWITDSELDHMIETLTEIYR